MNTKPTAADIDDGEEIDRVDPDLSPDDDDDEFEQKLLEMLAADDGGDDAVFSGPVKEKETATVSVEDGLDLVSKVTTERGVKRRTDALGEDDAPKGDDSQTGAGAEDPAAESAASEPVDPSTPPEATDLDALLEGLDDDRRGKIAARVKDADEVMALFKGREAQLAQHGVTAHQAMARLIQLNEYAAAKPVEYLAWATAQLAPDKAQEVLTAAAEKLGLKLTAADDDPFEDEEVKRLRAENRALRSQRLDFGPDAEAAAAAEAAQRVDPIKVITDFATEKNPDGTPKRPLWEKLKANIATRAKTVRETTGRVVTAADLAQFYEEEERDLRAALGLPAAPAATPAAQPAAPVAGGGTKKAAPSASVDRAKAASKSIDGTGQGASRRPAPNPDASIEDVLRHFAGIED